ncbi:isochorismate synthase [Nocardia sp. XZ_19_385]|uniref:isochorismate synthase n=1 Tax=Nocardia sp. XZ_19_385 TaxID=2769488 RepID=UPI002816942C|nr:isochorismate synthase [Nocardia sp. XZ_19_385]
MLSRPHATVRADGQSATFSDAGQAAAALRSGAATHIVGALPFDPAAPAALWAPTSVSMSEGPLPATGAALPRITVESAIPEAAQHLQRLKSLIATLSDAGTELEKVVLARALRLSASTPVSAAQILDRLVAGDAFGNGFSVDLTAAGPAYAGKTLVGATPEVLVRRSGEVVTCHPLAGSAPRHRDPVIDRETAAALLDSPKNLREHAFVVDQVRAALTPLCREVNIPEVPELTSTPKLWHLGTPITAIVRDPAITALDLALAMHPTPAICGTPTAAARDLITELEGDRGFYAGALGWAAADGDGEWMVSIRCAELSADGRSILAYAGGGIVAESDPDAELAETTTKFGTMLAALGATEH